MHRLGNGELKSWIEKWEVESLSVEKVKEFSQKLEKTIRCLIANKSEERNKSIEQITELMKALQAKLKGIKEKKIILYLKVVFESYASLF